MRASPAASVTLALALCATAAPAAVSSSCDASALGTQRILELPRAGAAYGRQQHGPLPLGPREVALTFDDGPRPETTPRVLQALKDQCVQATFFMNGEPMREHAALARQVLAEGHTVAMHGDRHHDFTQLPPEAQRADLQALQQTFQDVLGSPPAAWRFPYLAESPALADVLREQRITVMSVDVGIEDWLPGQSPELLAERLITRLRERGGGIVLLHDTFESTAAALPLMLRRLQQDGWQVVHLHWAVP
ncbi:MAG TPA: polysaccharide deacetylase family protein [Ideonella sp.]|uniref:polysaccharide deacetylase family protein n=1 Tax=Ideonella sp. TaxID=1929293 RepID=UPI002E30A5C8|nr:polysaccharide deacetylase family protein [Ideonella sp.]HEX5683988.1 polysaccharide deacetylase family protein [Ideonella sp.]